MPQWLLYVLSGILAYLLGSISTGILVSRFMHGPDLHTVGSKNTGATNVQRTMGWKPGLITFAGDSAKAVIACLLGQWITGNHMGALLCGLCVVVGHNWPVFFGLHGGKGVASSLGVILFCFPIPALISFALGLVIVLTTKLVSLASMSILTLYALLITFVYGGGNLWIILWAWVLLALCLLRHHANIDRLMKGTESRLGQKSEEKKAS